MKPMPPPEGWSLREAANALCRAAAIRRAEDPQVLARALLKAISSRPDLRVTGRDAARGDDAPRETVDAIWLRDAAITYGTGRIDALFDVTSDSLRITHTFQNELPKIPPEINVRAVRVETVHAKTVPPRAVSQALRPPRTVRGTGGIGRAEFGKFARAKPAAAPLLQPATTPPTGGWTLAEAASALLPDLYAAASRPPPKDWWMVGGAEPHKTERDALRLAFARLMQAGGYAVDGIVQGEAAPSCFPLHLWRTAVFPLGLPGEAEYHADLMAGGHSWNGVRVKWRQSGIDDAPDEAEAPKAPPSGDDRGAAVQRWMNDYTGRYVLPKRDPTLKECAKETGCRYREALAAWNALPSDRKRAPRQTDRMMTGR